jgi:DNA-binding transcriptional LysR family regulator
MAASRWRNDDMTSLDDLALFVRIAEAGSLAAAARSAELPKSSVSRRLATLEGRLGVSLIRRSTRRLALTDAGRALFERCAPLVAGLRAAESDVIDAPAEPHGRLRVTATGAFGRQFIGPLLSRFLERHPKVSAELVLLDRPVDLIAEGFDVAIRMGPLASSSLLRRKLAEIERVLCAAPAYLDRVGPVADLDELRRHEAVTSVEGNHWTFVADKGTRSVTLAGRFAGNDLATCATRRVAAVGLRYCPCSSSRMICDPAVLRGCSPAIRPFQVPRLPSGPILETCHRVRAV